MRSSRFIGTLGAWLVALAVAVGAASPAAGKASQGAAEAECSAPDDLRFRGAP